MNTVTAKNVTLNNCDKEQIHIPSSIQPHGVLLVLKEPHLDILQVSQNTEQLLGVSPEHLVEQPLSNILGLEQTNSITDCLTGDFEQVNPLPITLTQDNQPQQFNGIVHRSPDGVIILELEPIIGAQQANFFQFYQLTKGTLTKLQQAFNLEALCQIMVNEIQALTGFDRVMIYRFDPDNSGHVIAETKREDLEPFLGLHYPATDIPQPARRLYQLNLLRLIPDSHYPPVELPLNPETQKPFDLSYSVLRSVSPIHVEYLHNMGVQASMSISLLQNKRLWGLIACHHDQPNYVPYEIRTACEFFGQVMSLELAAKEKNQDLDYKRQIKVLQPKLMASLSQSDDWVEGLVKNSDTLLQLVGAEGVILSAEGELTQIGKTPSKAESSLLIQWLKQTIYDQNIFHTDALSQEYTPATDFAEVASGLLALEISKIRDNYILWFRPEVVQTVPWAGNPQKDAKVEADGSLTLSPRQSFDLWQETVKSRSLPWKECEIEEALELKNTIINIVLRKVDELAQLNLELQRSNNELDAFAYIASHDLKEPLRGIHNYSNFLLEDYAEILDTAGVNKLETLVQLTQRMEELISVLLSYSRLGRAELVMKPTNLGELIEEIQDVLMINQVGSDIEIRIPRPLPVVNCDPILVKQVFSNLINNAVKYNNNYPKWIELGWLEEESRDSSPGSLIFYVKDNGIGIREKHLDTIFRIFKRLHGQTKYGGGTGAGLTIVKKIVERHGGKIWVESTYGEGTTFYFTLAPEDKFDG
ncbi:MAG: ATP-binding protein [Coleofasciculus sp. D1-CHI-01]|uniref:ATP-binding protein n=1 Tax=Coleofasciculus sp. D1-CHI-01 TaxID=3068482 RepID=UPI00330321FD